MARAIGPYDAAHLLPHLCAFVAVVEAGGFTAAARQAGVDKTMVSRRVKGLETSLEVQLLYRTTRRVSPTQAGQALFDEVAGPVRDALLALQTAASPTTASGTVRLASLPALARDVITPMMARLQHTHPELQLEVRASESFDDVVGEGLDLAVRTGRMPDSTLIARKLGQWRYIVVASPAWVEAHPEVTEPEDLQPNWLLYGITPVRGGTPRLVDSGGANRWRLQRGDQLAELVMDPVAVTNDSQTLVEWALAGLGATAVAPMMLADHLQRGRLVRVLPEWRVDHVHTLYAVTPQVSYLPGRVQVVLDALREQVAAVQPRWEEVTE